MAGWRVGFTVATPNLVAALARIKNYHDYGAFTPLQVAAIAALEEGNQQSPGDAYAWFALIENKARIEQAGWGFGRCLRRMDWYRCPGRHQFRAGPRSASGYFFFPM